MQNPIDKMFFLGFLAGMWVGFGGIAGTLLGILFEFKELRSITEKVPPSQEASQLMFESDGRHYLEWVLHSFSHLRCILSSCLVESCSPETR